MAMLSWMEYCGWNSATAEYLAGAIKIIVWEKSPDVYLARISLNGRGYFVDGSFTSFTAAHCAGQQLALKEVRKALK